MAGTICLLAKDEVARYVSLYDSLLDLEKPPGTVIDRVRGHSIVGGLNASTASCLERGHDWLWVMGDDHVFAPDTLTRLVARDVPIVAPLNVQRHKPFLPLLYAASGEGQSAVHQWSWKHLAHHAGLLRLTARDVCGNAGMLIQREVLERLPAGEWWQDRPEQPYSEDVYFCERVRALGYDIYVDLDVRMGHSFVGHTIPVQNDKGEWLVGLQVAGKSIAYLRY